MLRQSEAGGGGCGGEGEVGGINSGGNSGIRNDKEGNGDVDRNRTSLTRNISKSIFLKLSSQNVVMEKLRLARETLRLRSGLLVVALLLHELLEGLHFGFLDKDKFKGKV